MRTTLFLLLFIASCTAVKTEKALQLPLDTREQTKSSLQYYQREGGLVVILLDAECPICQKYTRTIRELQVRHPKTAFVGVFTKWNDAEAIAAFAKEYEVGMPLLSDPRHKLIRVLKATTTPEVFLFDRQGALHYRGAIDNWFYALGNYRPQITEHYLEDAIKALAAGRPAPVSTTKPIGCIIQQ